MHKIPARWFRWGMINLAIVALYGVLMRCKMLFPLPAFEQKNLLHAHSHFAFSGWMSHFLYSGLTMLLSGYLSLTQLKKYQLLLALNIVCSFGMLLSFTLEGYRVLSISFSSLSIALAIAVAILFYRDRNFLPLQHPAIPWWKMALGLNILSAAGPLSLAYMMATKTIDPTLHSGAIHFYLHFQYNGWFFFGSVAMVIHYLPENTTFLKRYWLIFAIAVIPTFFLSVSQAPLPSWLQALVVTAAFVQLTAWLMLLSKLIRQCRSFKTRKPGLVNCFFCTSALALTLKFVLQAISVVPSVNHFALTARSAIIAYLHLVLLCAYSLFFVGFLLVHKLLPLGAVTKRVAFIFMAAVLLNEMLLGVQALVYTSIPFIHEMLLVAALLLLITTTTLAMIQFQVKHLPS